MIDTKRGTGCWLAAVCHSFLNSHAQRNNNKKKLDGLMVNIKLAPKNSTSLISRKSSTENISTYSLFLSYVRGLEGRKIG